MRIENVHTLILGAGPSGLAAGYILARAGLAPVLLEKDKVPGGLMRSIHRGEFVVDVGRKELYNRLERVDRFWNELLGSDYRTYPHRGGILYQGSIIDMSPAFEGFRRGMPWGMFLGCAFDLFWARLKPGQPAPGTVEDYFYQKRGRGLTRVFSQGFQEKLTGKKWSRLRLPESIDDGDNAGFVATLAEALKRAFSKKEVNTFKGIWKHPAKGTGQICDLVAGGMVKGGGKILFQAGLKSVSAIGDRVDTVVAEIGSDLVTFKPQHVISSVPLELLLAWLLGKERDSGPKPAFAAQPKRTVILAYLFLDEAPRFPHAWLQVTCPSTRIGRITNYTAFNGEMVPKGKTCLCCEYYCFGPDPLIEMDNAAIAKMTIEDCAKSGLIDPSRCTDQLVLKLPGADASQNRDNWMQASRLRQIAELARFKNLYCVNRTETDIATLAGIESAEAIIGGDRTDFDRHVDPAEIGIRSESKAFEFRVPAGAQE
jgi:protoporphyrinogen oxidase